MLFMFIVYSSMLTPSLLSALSIFISHPQSSFHGFDNCLWRATRLTWPAFHRANQEMARIHHRSNVEFVTPENNFINSLIGLFDTFSVLYFVASSAQ